MSIVFDTGALIALERNDKAMWSALKLAALRNEDVLVPSAALAEAWRGTARQARLSTALRFCEISSFDTVARAVGELCGRTRTEDIVDAHVAIVAAKVGDALYTSDPADMKRLVVACRGRVPSIVRC